MFKKWFITAAPAWLSPCTGFFSGEPLPWAGLSSDYLRLTKELFVFTGAVQRAESWAQQPGPSEEETLALKPDVCVGWKGRTAFQDTVCLSHNAPCEWRRSPLCQTIPISTEVYSLVVCVRACVRVCVCEKERGPSWWGRWPSRTHMVTVSEHTKVKTGFSACGHAEMQWNTTQPFLILMSF